MNVTSTRRVDTILSGGINLLGAGLAVLVALTLAGALTGGRQDEAIALAGIALVLGLTALHPRAGLLLWLVMAPFGRLFVLQMGRSLPDLDINRLVAIFLLGLLVAGAAAGRRRLAHLDAVALAGVLFVIGMVASIPSSRLGVTGGIQNVFDLVALPLLVYYFARNLLAGEKEFGATLAALALVGAVLGFITLREQITNQPILSPVLFRWAYGEFSVKVTSLFGAPATMALVLSLTVPATFIGFARAADPGRKLAFGAALAAIVAGLVSAYVRAGWLSSVVGLSVAVLLSRQGRRYLAGLLLASGLAALLLAGGLLESRALNERLQAEAPITYRQEALAVGLQIARTAPITGLGLDNYSDAAISAGWRPKGATGLPAVAPHNLFVYVLTSAGLVGLLPLLLLLGLLVVEGVRGWRAAGRMPAGGDDVPAVLLGSLAAYLLFANTFDALNAQFASLLLFALAGSAVGTLRLRQTMRGAA